jgi:hypothetical protein
MQANVVWVRQNKADEVTLTVRGCFGLVRFSRAMHTVAKVDDRPAVQLGPRRISVDTVRRAWRAWQRVKREQPDLVPAIRRALAHIAVRQWRWHTTVGLRRADHTALAVGALYALKPTLSQLLLRHLTVASPPSFLVRPDYREPHLYTHFACMFQMRLVHVIYAALRLKGGYDRWQNIQSKA